MRTCGIREGKSALQPSLRWNFSSPIWEDSTIDGDKSREKWDFYRFFEFLFVCFFPSHSAPRGSDFSWFSDYKNNWNAFWFDLCCIGSDRAQIWTAAILHGGDVVCTFWARTEAMVAFPCASEETKERAAVAHPTRGPRVVSLSYVLARIFCAARKNCFFD